MLGLVLNPRDGLEERDDIYIFFSFSNNVKLFDITNTTYNYIKLINTTLSLMIPMGEVKFSWPVARENLTEGSLSHESQFFTEHLYFQFQCLSVKTKSLLGGGAGGPTLYLFFFFFHFFSIILTFVNQSNLQHRTLPSPPPSPIKGPTDQCKSHFSDPILSWGP